ncbi:MAG TPA: hypothetical protein VMD02_06105 [Candidatus Omnitrophota bacterium]|nr:hypothetical protein [Candidatus Omnitrophota bacterium]
MDFINPVSSMGEIATQRPVRREDGAEEFAKIYYKEMLKQVFASQQEDEGALAPSFNRDIFIDKMAEEMARKNRAMLNLKGTGEAQ